MQKNEPTGITEKDVIGIEDEIGAEIQRNSLAQLESEKKLYEETLSKLEATIASYEEQWATELRLWEMQFEGDNMRPINPTKKVELLEEYWALQRKMLEYKFRETKHLGDGKLAGLKAQRDETKKNLVEVTQAIAKIHG